MMKKTMLEWIEQAHPSLNANMWYVEKLAYTT